MSNLDPPCPQRKEEPLLLHATPLEPVPRIPGRIAHPIEPIRSRIHTTYYIGLDVHKDSIAIAYTMEGIARMPPTTAPAVGFEPTTYQIFPGKLSEPRKPPRAPYSNCLPDKWRLFFSSERMNAVIADAESRESAP